MSAEPIGTLTGVPLTEEEWKRHRRDAVASLPSCLAGMELPDILLPFQKELLASTAANQLTVAEKSRRTGATWGVGVDAVLTAGAQKSAGGMDVLYLGYNLDMAREFIDTCAMWARAIEPAASAAENYLFPDGQEKDGSDRFIQAFRIRFASGFEIVALTSRPRSLRGRQGYVILDEFAFHDDAEELLKAAFALLIWGGKLLVISTHNGAENPFNKLIEEIRSGKKIGNVVRCTFDEAVEQGLYQRICLVTGKEWTPDGEAAWRTKIRKNYGVHAAEELDCVPSLGSGVYIPRVVIEACAVKDLPVLRLQCPDGFTTKPQPHREKFVEDWLHEHVDPVLAALEKTERHAYALDFARTGDLSVFVPLAIRKDLTRRAPFVIEMKNVPFEQQRQVVFYVTERLPRRAAGKFDATGNGAYLAEVTMQKYGEAEVECVTLSQKWYLENAPKLKAAIEDRSFEYPADDYLSSDLAMIKLVSGVPMVPQGTHNDDRDGGERHGDFAPAAMLAYAASLADEVATCQGFRPVPKAAGKFDVRGDDGDGTFRMRADEPVSHGNWGGRGTRGGL